MVSKFTVSAVMIVKNEERFLARCLESIRGYVDEIVVCDTGSTDNTVAIAKEYGAVLCYHEWADDFAEARNVPLKLATGDWVLQIDADEMIAPGQGYEIRNIARELDRNGVTGGVLLLHNALELESKPEDVLSGKSRWGGPMRVPRLFKRLEGLHFEYCIHESCTQWLLSNNYTFGDVPKPELIHYGSVVSLVKDRNKLERNMNLLKRRLEVDQHDLVAIGYQVMERSGAPEIYSAEETYEICCKAWEYAMERRHAFQTVHRLAVIKAGLESTKGDWDAMLKTVTEAEQLEGARPDFDHLAGYAHENIARRYPVNSSEMITHFLEAEQRYIFAVDSRDRIGDCFVDGSDGYASVCKLGYVLYHFGNFEFAAQAWKTALEMCPGLKEAEDGLKILQDMAATAA